MALINLTQTDDSAPACSPGVFCSGRSLNTDQEIELAEQGAAVGVTSTVVTMDGNAADLVAVWFECTIPAGASWDSGNFTVRINVTVKSANITWDSLDICRLNSGCTNQESLITTPPTTLGISLGTAGVKTHVQITNAATPSVGDKVMIMLGFNNSQMNPRDFTFLNDQIINTPFDDGVAPGARRIFSVT